MITRTRVNVLPLAISFVVKMALSLARLLATENLARFNGSHSFRPSHQVDHRENFIHYARLIAHIRSQVIDIPRNDTCATLNDNQEQVSRGYSWIGNRLVTIRVERILNFVQRFFLFPFLCFFPTCSFWSPLLPSTFTFLSISWLFYIILMNFPTSSFKYQGLFTFLYFTLTVNKKKKGNNGSSVSSLLKKPDIPLYNFVAR